MQPTDAEPRPRNTPRTARERVRAELVAEIKAVARRHLAEHGSAALSLRAIAREVGMVSSAVYRYFPSRDDLLTALIVDAYTDFGAAVTAAERSVRRSDFVGRWMAACSAARRWAIGAPQQYALIFGSPIPGYAAPVDTIDPATIVPLTLVQILTDADRAGRVALAGDQRAIPPTVRVDLQRLVDDAAPGLGLDVVARGVMAWTQLIGSISFELFGHLHNVIFDDDAYFEFQMQRVADELGLT